MFIVQYRLACAEYQFAAVLVWFGEMLNQTMVSIIYWENLIMTPISPHPLNQCCVDMFTQQVPAYIFQYMQSTSWIHFKYHSSIDWGVWGATQDNNVKKMLILTKFSNIMETIVRICWNSVHFKTLLCNCTLYPRLLFGII